MLADFPQLNKEDALEQTNNRSTKPANHDQLRSYWRYYAGKAHALHKNGKAKQAIKLFAQCISIANCLLHKKIEHTQQSGIELHYFASHNLAACQNQLQLGTDAEHTLRQSYQTIINLCSEPKVHYETKLDALSVLDKSLFSLTSQLAYLGKIGEIHELIAQTDQFAEKTMSILNSGSILQSKKSIQPQ